MEYLHIENMGMSFPYRVQNGESLPLSPSDMEHDVCWFAAAPVSPTAPAPVSPTPADDNSSDDDSSDAHDNKESKGTTPLRGWVIQDKMYIMDSKCEEITGVNLLELQTKIEALPADQWTKNSRNPKNKGQIQVGWSAFPGSQTTHVCGVNMCYELNSTKYLKEKEPKLWEDLVKVIEYIWDELADKYPKRAQDMLNSAPPSMRIGQTGFLKCSIGTNLSAHWHTLICPIFFWEHRGCSLLESTKEESSFSTQVDEKVR